jgi:hypothetical protein
MKKLINALKDLLYNITDYGLIIAVVVIMVSILSWRFDILFNKGFEKEAIASTSPVVTEPKSPDKENPGKTTSENPADSEKPVEPNKTPQEPSEPQKPAAGTGVVATIEIPNGSYPSKIGEILANSNLIDDQKEFLSRSVELGLDTKLRSGTFDIAVGTSLDNIIKIIANAN